MALNLESNIRVVKQFIVHKVSVAIDHFFSTPGLATSDFILFPNPKLALEEERFLDPGILSFVMWDLQAIRNKHFDGSYYELYCVCHNLQKTTDIISKRYSSFRD